MNIKLGSGGFNPFALVAQDRKEHETDARRLRDRKPERKGFAGRIRFARGVGPQSTAATSHALPQQGAGQGFAGKIRFAPGHQPPATAAPAATAKTIYFRAGVSRGRPQGVERLGGKFESGLIRGVSVITKGEAIGHGLYVDDVALQQVADEINRKAPKSRFKHPSENSDSLGTHTSRLTDARVEGNRVVADQHFHPPAHHSPSGDLAAYLMGLAEADPTSYGLSLAFVPDESAMNEFVTKRGGRSRFKSPDPANVNNFPHVRIAAIEAVDAVDQPAANPGGIFGS